MGELIALDMRTMSRSKKEK
ncbi:BnaC04g15510D [Brassica napus]|uniref:BnaC04g15510D protein n=1 Tax=Brassica napus TaxID=3708 RepID=A0A078FTU2_BRANA|nr:BnaC04g15510D [Brassica napus]